MNRPSRTEDDMVHPNWNQNPPFLAPDLTTCEDLNGIANSRMLKKASGGSVAAFGLLEKPGLRADSDSEADGRKSLVFVFLFFVSVPPILAAPPLSGG